MVTFIYLCTSVKGIAGFIFERLQLGLDVFVVGGLVVDGRRGSGSTAILQASANRILELPVTIAPAKPVVLTQEVELL